MELFASVVFEKCECLVRAGDVKREDDLKLRKIMSYEKKRRKVESIMYCIY